MINLEALKREEFDKVIGTYKLPPNFDYDFCFEVYSLTSTFVKEVVIEKGPYVANGINQIDVLNKRISILEKKGVESITYLSMTLENDLRNRDFWINLQDMLHFLLPQTM